jgi:hypothetical protein
MPFQLTLQGEPFLVFSKEDARESFYSWIIPMVWGQMARTYRRKPVGVSICLDPNHHLFLFGTVDRIPFSPISDDPESPLFIPIHFRQKPLSHAVGHHLVLEQVRESHSHSDENGI